METDTKYLTNENLKKELSTVGMSKPASSVIWMQKEKAGKQVRKLLLNVDKTDKKSLKDIPKNRYLIAEIFHVLSC